ncbi:MAG: hypothetical protein GX354_13000 [Firmicutes bacterium]|jgi:hypothetical protein|nr:hypothetical protein [Bacillota bacterium]
MERRRGWSTVIIILSILNFAAMPGFCDTLLARLDSGLKAIGISQEQRANIAAIAEYEDILSDGRLEMPVDEIILIAQSLGSDCEDTLLLMTIKMVIQAYGKVADPSMIDRLIESTLTTGMAPLDLAYELREGLELMGYDTGTSGQAIEAHLRAADAGNTNDGNIPTVGYSCCH